MAGECDCIVKPLNRLHPDLHDEEVGHMNAGGVASRELESSREARTQARTAHPRRPVKSCIEFLLPCDA